MATDQKARTISNVQSYAALFGAAIVGFGFISVPLTDASLPKATWLEWFIAILPVMPFTILALSIISCRRIPVVLAVALALVLFCVGAFATFVIMALSGGGTEMIMLHGMALTLACSTSILLASALRQKARSVAFGVYVLPTLVGIWSLAMVPLAYSSAVEESANREYCIGEHSPIERELSSILGLRGLSFYTTRSGYKIGDTWYFHGLLLVEDDSGLNVYNWSPRGMRFNLVEKPGSLIANPFAACQPKNGFLEELNLI